MRVTLQRTQNIYISDSANHRVCVYNHDCRPLQAFGREGFHTGELKLPRGIAVDEQEFIIVADSGIYMLLCSCQAVSTLF